MKRVAGQRCFHQNVIENVTEKKKFLPDKVFCFYPDLIFFFLNRLLWCFITFSELKPPPDRRKLRSGVSEPWCFFGKPEFILRPQSHQASWSVPCPSLNVSPRSACAHVARAPTVPEQLYPLYRCHQVVPRHTREEQWTEQRRERDCHFSPIVAVESFCS